MIEKINNEQLITKPKKTEICLSDNLSEYEEIIPIGDKPVNKFDKLSESKIDNVNYNSLSNTKNETYKEKNLLDTGNSRFI
jgi:hypothetical protein